MLRILTGALAPDKPELESKTGSPAGCAYFNRKTGRACVFGKL